MALIKCKECGNEISSKTKECPQCGEPVGKKQYSMAKGCLIIFAVLIFGPLFLGGLVTGYKDATTTTVVKPKKIQLTKNQYGEKWSFTVQSGMLECKGMHDVVLVVEGEGIFAINGKAQGRAKSQGYRRLNEILKTDPELGEGFKMAMPAGLIEKGLSLCN